MLGQYIADVMKKTANADIAFMNGGGTRTEISVEVITAGKLYAVVPFDNTLVTVNLTGKQVMAALEEGLINPKGPVQYSGLKMAYYLQQGKITAISMVDGTPFSLEKTYKVAIINDFMAEDGDGYTIFKAGTGLRDLCLVISEAVRAQKIIDFAGDERWQVVGAKERKKAA